MTALLPSIGEIRAVVDRAYNQKSLALSLIIGIRRLIRRRRRTFPKFFQSDGHSSFELRVMTVANGLRIEIHFHVRFDAGVFGDPFARRTEDSKVRSRNGSTIHERWKS